MRFLIAALFLLLPAHADTISIGDSTGEIQADIVATGNINLPIYATPVGGLADSVGGLILQTFSGTYLCSGTLLPSGMDILTAAHCVTDSAGNFDLLGGTATFFPSTGGSQTIAFAGAEKYSGYSGDSYAGNDLAVIHLQSAVSAAVPRATLYSGSSEVGSTYTVIGYGATGSNGLGDTGAAGTRHQGENQFDATLADISSFSSNVLMSDFDNGLAANDAFGYFFGITGLGLGTIEVSTAPGDSGGPAFINGEVAGITSFGLRLAYGNGATSDIDSTLDASFGEFNGFTRVAPYDSWILGEHSFTLAPEPATLLMTGASLFVVLSLRRRMSARK
jgi:secreted trypsin-like serine protease